MSKVQLAGNASGTGIFQIAAPNSNTDRTLTLPDATGTIALQGGAGVGKVLQVVNATYGTQLGTTSTSYTDTGLTASITPSSSSSKILVFANMTGLGLTNASTSLRLRLNRGATGLAEFEREAGYAGSLSTELAVGGSSISYLDSPATTSSTTYKVQFQSSNGNTVYVALSSSVCTITLMEIAA